MGRDYSGWTSVLMALSRQDLKERFEAPASPTDPLDREISSVLKGYFGCYSETFTYAGRKLDGDVDVPITGENVFNELRYRGEEFVKEVVQGLQPYLIPGEAKDVDDYAERLMDDVMYGVDVNLYGGDAGEPTTATVSFDREDARV